MTAEAPVAAPPATDAGRDRARLVLLVTITLLLVPFLVLVVRSGISSWVSSSDYAAIELRTRAVGTADTPLVGPYSRYGWNHPGPLLFYVLAVPYRLLGASGPGLLVGAALVNGAAVACSAWLLWRRGRTVGLALGALVIALLVHAIGGGELFSPWNPFVIVLPMFVLLLATWSACCGDHWMLPLIVGVASFATQSHLGAAVPALALVGVAIVFVVFDARRARVAHLFKLALVTAGVGLVCWLPALIDQVRPSGGNLTDILDFRRSPTEPGPGYRTAAELVAPNFGLRPPFITGNEPITPFSGGLLPDPTFPIVLVMLIAATAVALGRRDRESFTLDLVALTLAATAWVAAAGITGEPFTYLLRWTWIVGAFVWLAIAWTAWRALRELRLPNAAVHLARVVAVVAGAVALLLTVASTVSSARAEPPNAAESDIMRAISGPVETEFAGSDLPVMVRPAGAALPATVVAQGLVARMEDAGIAGGLETSQEWIVGSKYTVPDDEPHEEVVVATEDDELFSLRRDGQYREIARYDTLTAAERQQLASFNTELAAQDDPFAFARAHEAEWKRARALDARARRAVVFRRVS